ncbi:hypothetical protein GCM10022267_90540 [Lentzea roselyniae]|uniref:Streptomyces sporulation and cell division protein, SsgA n=1 Tax=Lentzea roselyniae TaxID=531940 RepID=A0ABP7CFW0_9PSEU
MHGNEDEEITRHLSFSATSHPGASVGAVLRYSTASPYEVTATFTSPADGSVVTWSFARELLFDGLFVATGCGDVSVRPAPLDADVIHLELRSDHGHAVLSTPVSDVAEFLAETHRVVAPGDESLWFNFDQELHRLVETG